MKDLRQLTSFYLKKVDEFSHTYLPKQSSEMHVRIDQESQRASKGDLYGYNVLNAGQYFLGELYCADETSWQQLQKMTGISENNTLTLRLGKARQRGYGKVTARFERLEDMPHAFVQVLSLIVFQTLSQAKEPSSYPAD